MILVGLQIGTQPPPAVLRAALLTARAMRLESLMRIDHFQNVFPEPDGTPEFTWIATQRPSPHEMFDYQVMMGYRAPRLGRMLIRLCLTSPGRISFSGSHFKLGRASMHLQAPPGRLPEIWVGGHGGRMLRLAGRYGDGWYPASVVSPQE